MKLLKSSLLVLTVIIVFAACGDDKNDENPVISNTSGYTSGGDFSAVFTGSLDFSSHTDICTYETDDSYTGYKVRRYSASGSDGHYYSYKLSFALKDDASSWSFNIADKSRVVSFSLTVYFLEDGVNKTEYYSNNVTGNINCTKLNDSDIVASFTFGADATIDIMKSVNVSGSLSGYRKIKIN